MSLFDPTDEDEDKDFLAELTGPGGKFDKTKYKSETEMYQAIAKGKVHGDRLLDHKLKEFDEMREDLLKEKAENMAKDKWEELLAKRQPPDDKPVTDTGTVDKSLKAEDLDSLLEQKLTAREMQKIEKGNLDKVEKRLEERYGHNASKVLKDKLNTLNMTYEDLKFLAKRSPDAVFNTLGLNQTQETFQSPPRGSLRTDQFAPSTDIPDAVFYEEMRRKDPKRYYSEKQSIQRLKDMDRPDFLTRYNQKA